jgi:predicted amidohydrolase YtcJ
MGKHMARFREAGLRPRIEHAQVLRASDISMFAKSGVVASVQPIHATSDRDIADRYWGVRSRHAYPFKTFLKTGVRVAFGSDAPIETANPMPGIHAAVTRKRAGENRPAWYPEQRISRRQAVECYTLGSAYACCYDDIAGSISIGKRADLAVLSDDIFEIKEDAIADTKVLMTVIDGRIAFGMM